MSETVKKVRAEQVPFPDLMKVFVKTGFKPDEMDKVFSRKEGTCRTRLRTEFNDRLPDEYEEREVVKDGNKVLGEDGKPVKELVFLREGGIRHEGVKLRSLIVDKVKTALGEEKAVECQNAIAELFKDLRVGGSGRKIDKEAILMDMEFVLE